MPLLTPAWPALALGILAGAALAAGAPSHGPTHLGPAERAQCEARHGRIMIAGLSGNEMCALPFPDAGRRCTDSSQCRGDCRYEGRVRLGAGARAVGRCQSLDYPFGCRTTVEHGRVTPGLCVD